MGWGWELEMERHLAKARIYKQYGFVHYTVPEEAEAAINGVNNRIIATLQQVNSCQLSIPRPPSPKSKMRDEQTSPPQMIS